GEGNLFLLRYDGKRVYTTHQPLLAVVSGGQDSTCSSSNLNYVRGKKYSNYYSMLPDICFLCHKGVTSASETGWCSSPSNTYVCFGGCFQLLATAIIGRKNKNKTPLC
ncbi:unnamed protein product, partial [Pylaiella littoralis]